MRYPCARLTDIGCGHGCFPPSPVVQGSPNVIVNNLLCARVTDAVQTHCCGTCHDRAIAKGSRTVIVNNLPCARLTSKIDCGGWIVTASPDVIIGGPWN